MNVTTCIRKLAGRLGDESGIALVTCVLVTAVLGIAASSVLLSSASGQRSATRSKADQIAFTLGEAGLSQAAAVLALPSNNALNPRLFCVAATDPLPCTQRTDLSGGYVLWGGTLDTSAGTWTLTAV